MRSSDLGSYPVGRRHDASGCHVHTLREVDERCRVIEACREPWMSNNRGPHLPHATDESAIGRGHAGVHRHGTRHPRLGQARYPLHGDHPASDADAGGTDRNQGASGGRFVIYAQTRRAPLHRNRHAGYTYGVLARDRGGQERTGLPEVTRPTVSCGGRPSGRRIRAHSDRRYGRHPFRQ